MKNFANAFEKKSLRVYGYYIVVYFKSYSFTEKSTATFWLGGVEEFAFLCIFRSNRLLWK